MVLPCGRITRLGAGPHLRFLHHQMGALGQVVPGRPTPTCPVGLYRLTAFSRLKHPHPHFSPCLVPAQGASPLAPRLSGTSRAPVGGVSVGSWYLARRLGVRAISPLDRDTKGPSAVGIFECPSLGLSMHQSWSSDVSPAPAISCSSPVSPRCLQATGWPWGNDTGPDA